MQDFEPNPLTKLFPLAVGAFGWQLHGFLIGLILAVMYIGVVLASNAQVMANASDGWMRKIQLRKWIVFVFFVVGLAISRAQVISA